MKFKKPVVDTFDRSNLSGLIQAVKDSSKQMSSSIQKSIQKSVLQGIKKDLTNPIEEIMQSISGVQRTLASLLEPLEEFIRGLPLETKKTLSLLGEHGWYLDLEMSNIDLQKLEIFFLKGNTEKAEIMLIEHFKNRLSEIENSISEIYKHRKHLIKAAFDAHRRKEYILSIPVFLAQTDGICMDEFGHFLFTKGKNKKDSIESYIKTIAATDTLLAALLHPLTNKTLPIKKKFDIKTDDLNMLNRHMVLHGASLNYNSETNSLKAISLINYVAHVNR